MYATDEDFKEIYKVCTDFDERYHVKFFDFLIQDGLLFKGGQLSIPRCSMRANISMEKHSGAMGVHFGLYKTLELLRRHYFSPKL